jgi:uncharacterized membrane protein YhaH (DUF805 family)
MTGRHVSFSTSIRTCFQKYFDGSGVATRPEFWWFALFGFLGSLVFALTGLELLRFLWSLALLCPGITVTVRRLHDTGRSAWWLLLWITIIGSLVIFVFTLFPSKLINNPYAADRATFASPTVTEASLSSSSSACPSCGKLRLPGQSYCMGCGTKFPDA